jgi:hypothetical protein
MYPHLSDQTQDSNGGLSVHADGMPTTKPHDVMLLLLCVSQAVLLIP